MTSLFLLHRKCPLFSVELSQIFLHTLFFFCMIVNLPSFVLFDKIKKRKKYIIRKILSNPKHWRYKRKKNLHTWVHQPQNRKIKKNNVLFLYQEFPPPYIYAIKRSTRKKNFVALKYMPYFIYFRNIWIAIECFRFALTLFVKKKKNDCQFQIL